MVELDVCRSKDDEPVLFHDTAGSLLMNCGLPVHLVDLTAHELTTIPDRASEEPIATFAQGRALCQQRRLGVMLDIKVPVDARRHDGFVRRLHDRLTGYGVARAAVSLSSSRRPG